MLPDRRPFESRLAKAVLDLQEMEQSQWALAEALRSTRSRVNRLLGEWHKASTIKVSERRIVIKNREALLAIAQRDDTAR